MEFPRSGMLAPLGLLGVYLLSFLLPVIFALKAANFYLARQTTSETIIDVFAHSLRIGAQGSYRRVSHNPALNPEPGADFLMAGWFKLNRFPERGQRVLLFSKFDVQSESREGFGVGISRDLDQLRPVVYWRDSKGKGGWYPFSEIEIPPQAWILVALSFRNDRYLGLHAATLVPGEKPKMQLLGGYDLNEGIMPVNTADLVSGASGQNAFRGEVGPAFVFSGSGLSDDFRTLLKDITRNPGEIPAGVRDDALKLALADSISHEDQGPLKVAVEFVGAQRRKERRARATGEVSAG